VIAAAGGSALTKRDYYEVLEVNRTASAEEIKRAYRKKAVQFHPDKNPDDSSAEEKFKEAAEAYSILSNPEKRAQYDRFGHAGVSGAGFNFERGFDPSVFGGFEDIFESFFGFGDIFGRGSQRGRSRAQRGNDLQYEMKITFLESAFGTKSKLKIPILETCEKCEGSGAAPGTQPVTCPGCQGSGQVRYAQGFFTIARTCARCGGNGRVIEKPCPDCQGRGRLRREKTIEVKIPAGVTSGTRLRLQGEGEAGLRGGPSGDLYILVFVEEDPLLQRDGNDILMELPISFIQAAMGTELRITTLYGDERLKIPSGTQPETVFRLRGKGFPEIGSSSRGDMYVRVKVEIPRKLNREQKKIFEKMAPQMDADSVKSQEQIFRKIRDSIEEFNKTN
jgi:molecular chaperone DnaJ